MVPALESLQLKYKEDILEEGGFCFVFVGVLNTLCKKEFRVLRLMLSTVFPETIIAAIDSKNGRFVKY